MADRSATQAGTTGHGPRTGQGGPPHHTLPTLGAFIISKLGVEHVATGGDPLARGPDLVQLHAAGPDGGD